MSSHRRSAVATLLLMSLLALAPGLAAAKKDPGKLNYGSTGVGSGSHLATELFMTRTGTKMTHVPFRGAAPLVTELMAGRIDVSNSTLPSVLGQIQSGDLKAIALASPQRNPVVLAKELAIPVIPFRIEGLWDVLPPGRGWRPKPGRVRVRSAGKGS